MVLNSLLIEAICEVIPLSKDNSPLRSPDILRRETRIGVSKFGLEYVTEQVNGVLQEQIGKISEYRLQSDKFYNRLAKKGTSHEYIDLNPKTLLRIVGSYVRKSQLRDKNDDYSRLSAIEAYELEKLYEFLKTEDGKQLLHEGIVDAMEIESASLSPEDLEKLKSLQFSSFRDDISDIDEKVKNVAKFTDSMVKSWKSLDVYVNSIRDILIRYYENELSILTRSIVNLDMQIKVTDTHANYGTFFKLVDSKGIFSKSIKDTTEKLATLNKERSIANPMRVQIVVQE